MSNNSALTSEIKQLLNTRSELTQKNEVVYFLLEVRKIIENVKNYPNLNFYCNWVLHSELTKKSTIKILSSKFDKFIEFSKSRKEIQQMIAHADNGRFIKMEDFKSELKCFLNDYKLPDFFNDRNWRKFRKLYLEIIHKCPISHGSSGITGLSLTKEKNGYYYEFYINEIVRIPRIKLKL